MANQIQSVSIVGSGNVATQLGEELLRQGIKIEFIFSRNSENAKVLAAKLNAQEISSLDQLSTGSLILICVSDQAISDVLNQIPKDCEVAYTSGSVELSSLPYRENLGVFYPLQTFSKARKVNIFEVPFFIEATNAVFAQSLFDLAWKLSRQVEFADSKRRKQLHLGAVLVNNFSNHLVYLAKEFLDKHDLDWKLLQPLLNETIEKLKSTEPYDAQTGPARRQDDTTISEHISMLEGLPKQVYELLSKSIENTYKLK